ncbi:MAG: TonB-dependent receptor [Janthinobacterium lividum]
MISMSPSRIVGSTQSKRIRIALASASSLLAMLAGPAFAQAVGQPPAQFPQPTTDQREEPRLNADQPGSSQKQPQGSVSAGSSDAVGAGSDIVVTGVRASVQSALNLRKNATQLQDSIVAEDIGKLPDNNVVEALQHVSGVSIIRNSVEPGTVLIRGLPDIATTLNGRQIFTSTGRFISLPDLPAELLARVDVKKSASADDLEGGIAGLIDVRLHRPFDFKGLEVAGGAKGIYSSLAKKVSPDASVLLSNRWETSIGEFGLLLDGSYQDRHVSQDQITIGQRTNRTAGVANAGTGPLTTIPAGSVATPNTVTFFQRSGVIERASLNASAQWKPADNLEFYSDFFYTRLRQKAPTDVNVFLNGTCANGALTTPFPGTNVGQNLTSGCYSLTSIQDLRVQEDTYQSATGVTWDATDRLTIKSEFSYTNSKNGSTNIIPDAQYNLPANGLTIGINSDGKGGTTVNQVGNPQLTTNQFYDQLYDQRNVRHGNEYDVRLDANYRASDEGLLRSVDVGYRFSSRASINDAPSNSGLNCANTTGDGSSAYNNYRLLALNSPACTAYRAALTSTSVGGVSYASLGNGATHQTIGSFFGGAYGETAWINSDPNFLYKNIETIRGLFGYHGNQDFIPTNHFAVTETSNAGYIKANYGVELFGIPIDGNIGVRVINTKLVENAFTQQYVPINPAVGPTVGANATCVTCVVYTPVTASKSDTQVLPSFNLRATLAEGLFFRVAASKTVTRPTFAQLNPGLTLSAATATLLGTASSGNANLTPEKSTNYDLDLSYYWGHANHVSIAGFHRDVEGYIQNVQSTLVVAGTSYILTQPANFQNAPINGVEVGYSQFLDFLPGALSGIGYDVNGTYIDAIFNNVAKYHVNASAIYEKGPFSFRFSYTFNSKYLVGPFAGGVQPQFEYAQVRENADLSFNYSVTKQLTVGIDATNLFDNYQTQEAGQGAQNQLLYPTQLSRFDRTFALSVRYRM